MSDPSRGRFRLNATVLAQHFKYGCDRRFRFAAVPSDRRDRRGTIGEGVPRPGERNPGQRIERLLTGGNEFELSHVTRLRHEAAAEGGWMAGGSEVHNPEDNPKLRNRVAELPFEAFLSALRRPVPPIYVAQPELRLSPAAEAVVLARVGLDPAQVEVGKTLPDLIEVRPPAPGQTRHRLRVWDFKMSRQAKLEHFVQVAWYTLLLEAVVEAEGLGERYAVDVARSVIVSRKGHEAFELGPYRRALVHFLRSRGASLLELPARSAEWHVTLRCRGCEFLEARGGCLQEAEDYRDLSRIPYLTAQAKRLLAEAGFRDHFALARFADELAALDPEEAAARKASLRQRGHSLAQNLDAYLLRAQALSGRESAIDAGARTLAMPARDGVRIVLSAEADGVTGTCFALGLKTVFWKDGQPAGTERVFVARQRPPASDAEATERAATPVADRADEAGMLYRFLRALNDLCERTHAHNVASAAREVPEDEAVRDAEAHLAAVDAEIATVQEERATYKGLNRRTHPEAVALRDDLDARLKGSLKERRGEAVAALDLARRKADAARWRSAYALHFYVYDAQDLAVLRDAVERHLLADGPDPALFAEMRHLVRLFPPESLLADADTFRSVPLTVLTSVLKETMALRVPYGYDLRGVTEHFRAVLPDGRDLTYRFLPTYDFVQPRTNQVAFERIHDVWDDEPFEPDPRDPARTLTPEQVLGRIEQTVTAKLRATESVVKALQFALDDRLLLRKEKFKLHADFDPLAEPTEAARLLDTLSVFVWLEESLAELAVKQLHTLPAEVRASRYEAVHGMRLVREELVLDPDDPANLKKARTHLTFAFPEADRDVKFEPGAFGLVLTRQDRPEQLLWDVDGPLFRRPTFAGSPYRVGLVALDRASATLTVSTPDIGRLRDKIDLPQAGTPSSDRFVLDGSYSNVNTPKVLEVLSRLRQAPEAAPHVASLLMTGTVPGWTPSVTPEAARSALAKLQRASDAASDRAGRPRRSILNVPQENAFVRGFGSPLGLVWGPPGTGKTHTIAHQLLGHVLAAEADGRRLRVLVSAFTHHAIATVLEKVAALADAYGLTDRLRLGKVRSGSGNPADDALPPSVERISPDRLAAWATDDDARATLVGATVYGVHTAMRSAGGAPQPWFDVLLVDEASQMRVPEALMALAATHPGASVLLAGDDKQLPPIIQGQYRADAIYLSSVFSFARERMRERMRRARTAAGAPPATDRGAHAAADAAEDGVRDATLFLLRENYRMNEPLTAYPRVTLYENAYDAFPGNATQRIELAPPTEGPPDPLVEALLDPERPVVLVRYTPHRPYAARNDLEASLATRLALALSARLHRPDGLPYHTPVARPDGPQQPARHELPGEAFALEGLAILAPHRAQNALLRARLREHGFVTPSAASGTPALADGQRVMPLVDTVEKLQGKERDVVIVTYGVADAEYAEAEAAFLLSQNRFNVAATRARRKLVVFLSDAVLEALPTDRDVLLDAMMLKEFSAYCCDGEEHHDLTDEAGHPVKLRVLWRGFPPPEGG